jgi:hypothetical protein
LIGNLTNTGKPRIGLDLAQEGLRKPKSEKGFSEVLEKGLDESSVNTKSLQVKDGVQSKDTSQKVESVQPKEVVQIKDTAKVKNAVGINESEPIEEPTKEPTEEMRMNEPIKGVINKRQKAIQKFMDSAESEFGIPPTGVLEAMAKMGPKEMLADAQDTASVVVSEVGNTYGLDTAQKEKLFSMYTEMLNANSVDKPYDPSILTDDSTKVVGLSSGPLGLMGMTYAEKPKADAKAIDSDEGTNSERNSGKINNSKPIVSSSPERRKFINDSLDKMNNSFFINNNIEKNIDKKMIVPESLNIESVEYTPPVQTAQTMQTMQNIGNSASIENASMANLTPKTTDELLNALSFLDDSIDNMIPVNTDIPISREVPVSQESGGSTVLPNQFSSQTLPQQQQQSLESFQQQFSQNNSNQQNQWDGHKLEKAATTGKSAAKGKDESAVSSEDFFAVPGSESREPALGGLEKTNPSSRTVTMASTSIAGLQIKDSDRAANIEKIMSQTQSLAKAGGGEMKVRLSPDGLGQVQLKVNLLEGKVNVQVSTESKEAKELIESSLRDLKHNLSSHRVAVDNIKVDVGLQGNSDSLQQNQNFKQGHGDFSRESARQFLQQFRDGNFQQRSGILEAQGVRAYGPKHEAVDLDAAVVGSKNVGSHKGSGVNLVA